MNPAPKIEADKELDELFNNFWPMGMSKKNAKQQLLAWRDKAVVAAEKAFGGCKKCYGKGYATVNDRWLAHDTDQDIGSPGGYTLGGQDFAIKYCTCDRGKQLNQLSNGGKDE